MASRDDWAFDIREHVQQHYADKIGFRADEVQRYPDRVTGEITEEHTAANHVFRAVVVPKGVGPDHAVRYRRWVTLPSLHWQNLTARPTGWRYFVLMVGLLPDGQPWWSALYEEWTLTEMRDQSENMGGFYRWDPHLAARALVAEWDKDKPGMNEVRDVITILRVYLCSECRLLADFEPDDPAVTGKCPGCGTDAPAFEYTRTYPPVSADQLAELDRRTTAILNG